MDKIEERVLVLETAVDLLSRMMAEKHPLEYGPTIAKVLRGWLAEHKDEPTRARIRAIAKALNVSFTELHE